MSDDLNNEQIVLASAYVDDDVTAAERAQVEGDPQLVAEVERLRSVRTSLADTATIAISTRERHLAAALQAWDRLSDAERTGDHSGGIPAPAADPAAAAGAATVTAPTPLSDRRHRRPDQRMPGWLLTAAAVVLVVAGGGLIVRGVLDSGSNDSGDAVESAEVPSQREELRDAAADESFDEEPTADLAAPTAERAESAIGSTEGRPDDIVAIDSPELLAQFAGQVLAEEAELAQNGADDTSAASLAADAPAEVEAESADAPVETDAGAEAPAFEAVPTDADVPDLTCGLVDRIIADAEYGTGLFAVSVAVGVDADETEVIAYRIESCEVVARAPLGG